jgi:hypothetical protein
MISVADQMQAEIRQEAGTYPMWRCCGQSWRFHLGRLHGRNRNSAGKAEELAKLAQEQADREEETRKWVANGKTIEDLLNEFGRI